MEAVRCVGPWRSRERLAGGGVEEGEEVAGAGGKLKVEVGAKAVELEEKNKNRLCSDRELRQSKCHSLKTDLWSLEVNYQETVHCFGLAMATAGITIY